MPTHIKRKPITEGRFVTTPALMEVVQVSGAYLQDGRKTGLFKKGMHYTTLPGSNRMLWNLDLVKDLFINADNPEAHERACEAYLAALPSSQVSRTTAA
jgi:hypothetical protein